MIDEVTRARFVVLRDEDTGEVRHTDYQLYTRINIIPPTKAKEEGRTREDVIKISRLEALTAYPSDS